MYLNGAAFELYFSIIGHNDGCEEFVDGISGKFEEIVMMDDKSFSCRSKYLFSSL